ncbi:MAG: hypothetical protein M1832_005461 [Thelocarpon impressellum]|nr:MAG: hypothetical protein M1832_005461 [Thelocarpon impressellum]
MRQLSRRMSRPGVRNSEISDAELLAAESDRKAQLSGGRARSTSGSSAVLLNRHCASDGRGSGSGNLESMSASGRARRESEGGYTPTTPGAQSTFSYMPAGPPGNVSAQSGGSGPGPEAADPYYRPPRRRAPTMDSPGAPSRGSWASGDWINKRWSHASASRSANMDPLYGPSISGRGTPVPAYLTSHELSDSNVNEHRRDPTDYAVREVDFYYGVRGPALSNLPTRRLGTGPADPTGPAASAAGWFKGLFGGKTKDKGKGFEVVRSARAPPQGLPRSPAEGDLPPSEGQGMAAAGPRTPRHDAGPRPEEIGRAIGPEEASFEGDEEQSSEDDEGVPRRFSDVPPSLPSIDTGGSIELPSRVGSAASGRNRMPPKVPRKSSKRRSALAGAPAGPNSRLSAIRASPPQSPRLYDPPPTHPQHQAQVSSGSSFIVPFERTPSEAEVSRTSTGVNSVVSSMLAHTPDEGGQGGHARHSSSALGGMAVDTSGQRTSLGYVQQHRASDNVHKVVQGQHEGVDYLGSSAEVVEAGRRASLQSQGSHGRA